MQQNLIPFGSNFYHFINRYPYEVNIKKHVWDIKKVIKHVSVNISIHRHLYDLG